MARQDAAEGYAQLLQIQLHTATQELMFWLQLDKDEAVKSLDTHAAKARTSLHRMCSMREPWEKSWKDLIQTAATRVGGQSMAALGMTPENLLYMIRDYEIFKKEATG